MDSSSVGRLQDLPHSPAREADSKSGIGVLALQRRAGVSVQHMPESGDMRAGQLCRVQRNRKYLAVVAMILGRKMRTPVGRAQAKSSRLVSLETKMHPDRSAECAEEWEGENERNT